MKRVSGGSVETDPNTHSTQGSVPGERTPASPGGDPQPQCRISDAFRVQFPDLQIIPSLPLLLNFLDFQVVFFVLMHSNRFGMSPARATGKGVNRQF
jgi:hypothetical protein